jgi:iron complex transport system ATP-binding protein
LLQAADLTFGYGETSVLEGVSFDVPSGGFVGIIGPNGSGKTTLLRLLAGTRRPVQGAVRLDGRDLTTISRLTLARRMAVVPQETHLAFEYSVLEVVLMGRYPHMGPFAIEGPSDIAIARRALDSTGTLALAGRAFSTLSGGEKQRVIIASALAQIESAGPDLPGAIMLLDEPTAALDLKYQIEIGSLLRDLHDRHGLTVVLSTHDLNFAAALCDRLVLLKNGRVLASGPLAEIMTPQRIEDLYDVEADVAVHPRTGHLTVVPVRTIGGRR